MIVLLVGICLKSVNALCCPDNLIEVKVFKALRNHRSLSRTFFGADFADPVKCIFCFQQKRRQRFQEMEDL